MEESKARTFLMLNTIKFGFSPFVIGSLFSYSFSQNNTSSATIFLPADHENLLSMIVNSN